MYMFMYHNISPNEWKKFSRGTIKPKQTKQKQTYHYISYLYIYCIMFVSFCIDLTIYYRNEFVSTYHFEFLSYTPCIFCITCFQSYCLCTIIHVSNVSYSGIFPCDSWIISCMYSDLHSFYLYHSISFLDCHSFQLFIWNARLKCMCIRSFKWYATIIAIPNHFKCRNIRTTFSMVA